MNYFTAEEEGYPQGLRELVAHTIYKKAKQTEYKDLGLDLVSSEVFSGAEAALTQTVHDLFALGPGAGVSTPSCSTSTSASGSLMASDPSKER